MAQGIIKSILLSVIMHFPLVSIFVSVYIEPDLEYTFIRPAWLADTDEVTYSTTGRHDRFKGMVVSRKSVAPLVVRCIGDPKNFSYKHLGVNRPNTDGVNPAFY